MRHQSKSHSRANRGRCRRFRPRLEVLEDRLPPSNALPGATDVPSGTAEQVLYRENNLDVAYAAGESEEHIHLTETAEHVHLTETIEIDFRISVGNDGSQPSRLPEQATEFHLVEGAVGAPEPCVYSEVGGLRVDVSGFSGGSSEVSVEALAPDGLWRVCDMAYRITSSRLTTDGNLRRITVLLAADSSADGIPAEALLTLTFDGVEFVPADCDNPGFARFSPDASVRATVQVIPPGIPPGIFVTPNDATAWNDSFQNASLV